MVTAPSDKVIVTHKGALGAKYKPAGLKKIEAAIDGLVAADAARGLVTTVVDLSSAAHAKKYKFKVVPAAAAAKLHKQAIDKIFAAMDRPDYLMLSARSTSSPMCRWTTRCSATTATRIRRPTAICRTLATPGTTPIPGSSSPPRAWSAGYPT